MDRTDEEEMALEGEVGPDDTEELTDPSEDEAKQLEKLQLFGASMAKRRDEWMRARATAGHDKRWAEDLAQYNGQDAAHRSATQMMTSVEAGFPITSRSPGAGGATRSTVFVQVTRQKTNALAARWSDVQCPTDERNFGVVPTPIPGMPSWIVPAQVNAPAATPANQPSAPAANGADGGGMTGSGAPPIGGVQPAQAMAAPGGPMQPPGAPDMAHGSPLTPISDAAQQLLAEQREAHIRAEAMQQEIEDAFAECDMISEQRKVIFDAALYGVGVLMGPVVVNRTRKAWTKRTDARGNAYWTLEVVQDLSPASFRIDPRLFWPDPACGDNVQDGRGAFYLSRKTPKQVRDLAKQPAYIRTQLELVLEEGPKAGKASQISGIEMEDRDVVSDEVYEHWIYWGEVEREDLEAAGVEVPEDSLAVVSACIEMVNSTVVRAYLNPLADAALPFDMTPCEQIPGSVWGYGVPYLMRSQQRVINAGWRMILDNAGVSSGPQIVVKPGLVQPADKAWELSSRKIWYANDDVDDVRKAFTTFEFNSHQAELSAIIQMADKLSDQETAVPMIAQGQQGSAPETVGGMQMLMNSANVMLRRLVKQFDDKLIKPHVRRYYNYLMEYSEKEAIKGDFLVVALGSSSLVVRDIQNQAFNEMLQLATNPAFAPLINLKKLYERALRSKHIDPADIMNTDEQIAQIQQAAAQNQQPDPRIEAAKLRADADRERTAAQVQMNEQTLQAKQSMEQNSSSVRMQELQMQREIAMMQLAQKEGLTLQQIKAQLAMTAITERTKQDMQAREMDMKATTGEGI